MGQDQAFVLMEVENETGFLTNMRGSYILQNHGQLVNKIYLKKEEDEKIHLFVSVNRDVEDWEYSAILDAYDTNTLENLGCTVQEIEEFNPVWEIIFPYDVRHQANEEKMNQILASHAEQLEKVMDEIKDKKELYEEME